MDFHGSLLCCNRQSVSGSSTIRAIQCHREIYDTESMPITIPWSSFDVILQGIFFSSENRDVVSLVLVIELFTYKSTVIHNRSIDNLLQSSIIYDCYKKEMPDLWQRNDQTTTKTPIQREMKSPLSLTEQGMAGFLHVVDDTGLEPVTPCTSTAI